MRKILSVSKAKILPKALMDEIDAIADHSGKDSFIQKCEELYQATLQKDIKQIETLLSEDFICVFSQSTPKLCATTGCLPRIYEEGSLVEWMEKNNNKEPILGVKCELTTLPELTRLKDTALCILLNHSLTGKAWEDLASQVHHVDHTVFDEGKVRAHLKEIGETSSSDHDILHDVTHQIELEKKVKADIESGSFSLKNLTESSLPHYLGEAEKQCVGAKIQEELVRQLKERRELNIDLLTLAREKELPISESDLFSTIIAQGSPFSALAQLNIGKSTESTLKQIKDLPALLEIIAHLASNHPIVCKTLLLECDNADLKEAMKKPGFPQRLGGLINNVHILSKKSHMEDFFVKINDLIQHSSDDELRYVGEMIQSCNAIKNDRTSSAFFTKQAFASEDVEKYQKVMSLGGIAWDQRIVLSELRKIEDFDKLIHTLGMLFTEPGLGQICKTCLFERIGENLSKIFESDAKTAILDALLQSRGGIPDGVVKGIQKEFKNAINCGDTAVAKKIYQWCERKKIELPSLPELAFNDFEKSFPKVDTLLKSLNKKWDDANILPSLRVSIKEFVAKKLQTTPQPDIVGLLVKHLDYPELRPIIAKEYYEGVLTYCKNSDLSQACAVLESATKILPLKGDEISLFAHMKMILDKAIDSEDGLAIVTENMGSMPTLKPRWERFLTDYCERKRYENENNFHKRMPFLRAAGLLTESKFREACKVQWKNLIVRTQAEYYAGEGDSLTHVLAQNQAAAKGVLEISPEDLKTEMLTVLLGKTTEYAKSERSEFYKNEAWESVRHVIRNNKFQLTSEQLIELVRDKDIPLDILENLLNKMPAHTPETNLIIAFAERGCTKETLEKLFGTYLANIPGNATQDQLVKIARIMTAKNIMPKKDYPERIKDALTHDLEKTLEKASFEQLEETLKDIRDEIQEFELKDPQIYIPSLLAVLTNYYLHWKDSGKQERKQIEQEMSNFIRGFEHKGESINAFFQQIKNKTLKARIQHLGKINNIQAMQETRVVPHAW